MADDVTPAVNAAESPVPAGDPVPDKGYDEFEVGEHKVPWFLWVAFTLIVAWASISWIKFFGY